MVATRVLPLTNWKREPDQTEVFAGLIFKKKWSSNRALVNKVAVDFFADQKQVQRKTVLERHIGPDFDVPDDYGNLKNLPYHPFNQAPSNWEEIPYSLDYAFRFWLYL